MWHDILDSDVLHLGLAPLDQEVEHVVDKLDDLRVCTGLRHSMI